MMRNGLLAGLLFLCQASFLSGEAAGSPSELLKKGQWMLGLDVDSTVARELKTGGTSSKAYMLCAGHSRGYGLTDWLSVFGTIGAGYVSVKDNLGQHGFNTNLLASGQLKLRLWQSRGHGWEWDASSQYAYVGLPHRHSANDIVWHEWQGATSLSRTWDRWAPYLGVKYDTVHADVKLRQNGELLTQSGSYHSTLDVGPFLGFDWWIGEEHDTAFNLEVSAVGGAEMTCSLRKRF